MEQPKGINIIVWSKDRPIQLNLCLESLVKNFKEASTSTINVVYRASSDSNTRAYDKLRDYWRDRESNGDPRINFIYDTNFYLMSSMAFGYHLQTMFVVDDQVFYNEFSVTDEPFRMQLANPDKYFTVSLRLDPTKDYCYPIDQKQPIPDFDFNNGETIAWPWSKAQFDWGYVASLDGNVYLTVPIRALFMKFPPQQVQNPNVLEMLLNTASQQGAVVYPPQVLAYTKAKTVSIPANKVQTTFENRYEEKFTVEMLFAEWEKGNKIDLEDAISKVKDSKSPHTPIDYTFIPR